jgi:hypothetical protein
MPSVGFEPTVMTSARAKTVHTLDHWAIVTGAVHLVFYSLHQGNHYQQQNINAERQQFPHSQLLKPDDRSKHVVKKTFKGTKFNKVLINFFI